MESLSIKDVVTLAAAGYKKKDVMELIEASKAAVKEPIVETTEPETQTTQTTQTSDITVTTPSQDKAPEPTPKESEKPEATEDFKAKYEAEKARADSLQNKLIRQDVSGSVTEQEVDLVALVRDFC